MRERYRQAGLIGPEAKLDDEQFYSGKFGFVFTNEYVICAKADASYHSISADKLHLIYDKLNRIDTNGIDDPEEIKAHQKRIAKVQSLIRFKTHDIHGMNISELGWYLCDLSMFYSIDLTDPKPIPPEISRLKESAQDLYASLKKREEAEMKKTPDVQPPGKKPVSSSGWPAKWPAKFLTATFDDDNRWRQTQELTVFRNHSV